MTSAAFVWLQRLLPQRLLGRCVYHLARCRRPVLKSALVRWFAWRYAVSLDDAEQPDLAAYASFNDFFTRALRADTRPLAAGETSLISAADGCVTEFGTAVGGQALQAKGMPYALDELLGPRPPATAGTTLGDFVTVYLAPSDYHRVHLPLAGTLVAARYVPGKRYSVDGATALAIPRLFCRNERLVLWFVGAGGPLAVVLVGALNVASLSTPWLGEIASAGPRVWTGRDLPPERIERGAEIGRFNLGSTVVTVLPAGSARWEPALATGLRVRMGTRLATVAPGTGP